MARTLAIGDIHGCHQSLTTLEKFAEFQSDDLIITLGDYVDRGPDTKSVVQWLIDRKKNARLVALRGNHELMMLAAIRSKRHEAEWLNCGGKAVLESYGIDSAEDVPAEHWAFLNGALRATYQTQTHFFVHANAYPDIPIDEQPEYMMYWERFGDPAPHESGLTMVCGHTSQHNGYPKNVEHAVCIDTWACGRGCLTCMDVSNGFCWQANENGETRSFWLAECP